MIKKILMLLSILFSQTTVSMYDSSMGESLETAGPPHNSKVTALAVVDNKDTGITYVVTGSDDGELKVWNSETEEFVHSLHAPDLKKISALASYGKQLVSGGATEDSADLSIWEPSWENARIYQMERRCIPSQLFVCGNNRILKSDDDIIVSDEDGIEMLDDKLNSIYRLPFKFSKVVPYKCKKQMHHKLIGFSKMHNDEHHSLATLLLDMGVLRKSRNTQISASSLLASNDEKVALYDPIESSLYLWTVQSERSEPIVKKALTSKHDISTFEFIGHNVLMGDRSGGLGVFNTETDTYEYRSGNGTAITALESREGKIVVGYGNGCLKLENITSKLGQ